MVQAVVFVVLVLGAAMAEISIDAEIPRLEFLPVPPKSNVESKLIWYKANDEGTVKYWTDEIDKFLETYKKGTTTSNRVECDYNHPLEEGKVCNVPVDKWKPCVSDNSFGYLKSAPCIFLKLNKIYNWKPETYNSTDVLPTNMPKYLKHFIKNNHRSSDMVWVSCEGENPADNENIGPLQFFPGFGFPRYYFPFTNTDGYLSPLVAIYFERPETGVLINIVCKLWAKNIQHLDQQGLVHFELLID